tara:strand:- start:325 stop:552 length:228 start_codon:yes stop_codon:yes gene_type:complete
MIATLSRGQFLLVNGARRLDRDEALKAARQDRAVRSFLANEAKAAARALAFQANVLPWEAKKFRALLEIDQDLQA